MPSPQATAQRAEGTGPAPVTVDVRVARGPDDAEQAADGGVNRTSTDLELVTDASSQTVAIRFADLGIPQGAGIRAAWVQFTADEIGSAPTELVVAAHDSDNAPTPGANPTNLTDRNRTTAAVAWSPPAWDVVGEAGPDQRTPDLSPVLQEVVDRRHWWTGSALALLVAGTGHRTAIAHDGDPGRAPLLHVEYDPPASGPAEAPLTRLGVIGDFGDGGGPAGRVASIVGDMEVDAVLTVGDNSYGSGAIDDNIGRHYEPWIGAYTGAYGSGAAHNRFFPTLGNHDLSDGGGLPAYLRYFTLPGAGTSGSGTTTHERYYDVVLGPVHAFFVNSNSQEPDGIGADSTQARWLRDGLAASTSPWQVVLLHHAPFSSSAAHGSNPTLQWPFAAWGADLVLAGHDHSYERLAVDGIPYVVNGLGGVSRYGFGPPLPQSVVRHVDDEGALLLSACAGRLDLQFRTVGGAEVDDLHLGGPWCGSSTVTADRVVTVAGVTRVGGLPRIARSDDQRLVVREARGPDRTSRLALRAPFDVPANRELRLVVEAHRRPGPAGDREGDDVAVEWSRDGGPYRRLLVITRTADTDRPQIATLPGGVRGPVTVRLRDLDRTPGHDALDTLLVDQLVLRIRRPG